MKPKVKTGRIIGGWVHMGPVGFGLPGNLWVNELYGLQVISSIDGTEYHVSARRLDGAKCNDNQMIIVRASFEMDAAYEDNSEVQGSNVRHLWLAVAKEAAS